MIRHNPCTWLAKDLTTGNFAFGRTLLEAADILLEGTPALRTGERMFFLGRVPTYGLVLRPADLATPYAVSWNAKFDCLTFETVLTPAWANRPAERTAWFGAEQKPTYVGVYQRNVGTPLRPLIEYSCWDGKRWLNGNALPHWAGLTGDLPHPKQHAPWCGLRRDPYGC